MDIGNAFDAFDEPQEEAQLGKRNSESSQLISEKDREFKRIKL